MNKKQMESRCSQFCLMVFHTFIPRMEDKNMATNKRVFTLRLSDEVFDKIGVLATNNHRSMTNYIEFVLIQHLEQTEKKYGKIKSDGK
jgi:Arc-like DNA binding domain.